MTQLRRIDLLQHVRSRFPRIQPYRLGTPRLPFRPGYRISQPKRRQAVAYILGKLLVVIQE
jgi:hypothetical protein